MSEQTEIKVYIVPEVPQALKDECFERIQMARTTLILRCPFFGVLAAHLQLVENNTWCSTMATNGHHLYYNVEFVLGVKDPERRDAMEQNIRKNHPDVTDAQMAELLNGLTQPQLIGVICHEILHCAYNHFMRLGTRDQKLFNKAADYAINQIIKRESNMGEIGANWLYDERFDKMPAEEIYNILREEQQQQQQDGDGNGNGGGTTIDQHDIPGENLTEEEKEKYMSEFKDAMINAAMASKDSIPPEIRAMIDEFKEPKIDWRSKLNRTLRSLIKNDVSYRTPSRRSWVNGIGYGNPIFPGMTPDNEIDICVALDASGSIREEWLKDFLSEVYGITQQFTQFKLRILTFDTSVYEVHDYHEGEERKILEYPVRGGGGTLFTAVWDHMKETEYKPKQLVMFTDGEPWESWGDPDYCETLFVIHSNPKVEAPFGQTVHYELED